MADLTVIILTKNEEKNIIPCIESVKPVAERIVVIDSYSDDSTVELARNAGAEVMQNKWVNHAVQFTFALDNADIRTKWVMRLDADERLTEESARELTELLEKNSSTDVNGIIVRFEVTFLGRKLKHGGIYPFRKLIAFKYGKAHIESRNMDEHIVLDDGRAVCMKNDSLHCDYKDLSAWIAKHNDYSSKEVLDYQAVKGGDDIRTLNGSAKFKRFIKYGIYYRLPGGTRAHLYYWYRYYFRLGFLDGREGKIFAFMQAYWYRYLVDAKIYEKQLKEKQ